MNLIRDISISYEVMTMNHYEGYMKDKKTTTLCLSEAD